MMVNIYWLVVSTPLKNISHSFALSRNVEATAALCSGRSNCPKLLAEHLHRKEKPANVHPVTCHKSAVLHAIGKNCLSQPSMASVLSKDARNGAVVVQKAM